MKDIQNIFSVVQQISNDINAVAIQSELQNLTRLRANLHNDPQNFSRQVIPIIDKIIASVSSINTSMWTPDHEYVAEKLEVNNLIGKKGAEHFREMKIQLQSNPSIAPTILQSLITDIGKIRTKPLQLYNLLQPFEVIPITNISDGEGIIEITFKGDASIDDFKDAKSQMADWYLIIEGYARILNIRREDFEIISITKSSPTKFKIKTAITNVTLILGVVSSVLLIEKTILENKLMIEKLKQNNIVSDAEIQKRFIEDAEKHIEDRIKDDIDRIVEEKLKEYDIKKGEGDIKNSFAKAVENQYNFVIKGGDVDVFVIDEKVKVQVEGLNKTKEELKQIKDAYDNQKEITMGDSINKPSN